MTVIPFNTLITDYPSVVRACLDLKEPVALSYEGKQELVAMEASYFDRKEAMLEAQCLVLEAYAEDLKTGKRHNHEQIQAMVDALIHQA